MALPRTTCIIAEIPGISIVWVSIIPGIECGLSFAVALNGAIFDQLLQGVLNGCLTDRGDKFPDLALCKLTNFVAYSLAHQFDGRKLFVEQINPAFKITIRREIDAKQIFYKRLTGR